MERRHLKDHTSRVHQGQIILEKVALNQPVLKVVLKEPDSKRVHSDGNENKKAKFPKTDLHYDDTEETLEEGVLAEQENINLEAEDNYKVTNEDILCEIKESRDQIIDSVNRLWKGEANITILRSMKLTVREQGDDVKHKLLKARSKFEVANAHKELEYIEQVDYIICRNVN